MNPKNSQKAMKWCLDTALGLVLDAINCCKTKISPRDLHNYICENTTGLPVTHGQVTQMVHDLRRRHYISFDDGDSVVLTNKAKIKIIDRVVMSQRVDGSYRFVSFDIPESKRLSRDGFRRAIKRMGFCQIQKSLWVTDRNIGDFVEIAAAEYCVSDYVAYFVADKSNIDQHIKNVLNGKFADQT